MLDTRLIERANIIGGPEGVLLALGPDLTVGEWANKLGMSPGEVRAVGSGEQPRFVERPKEFDFIC